MEPNRGLALPHTREGPYKGSARRSTWANGVFLATFSPHAVHGCHV